MIIIRITCVSLSRRQKILLLLSLIYVFACYVIKLRKGTATKGANIFVYVRNFSKIESKQQLAIFYDFLTCLTLKFLQFVSSAVCDLILQWILYKST